MNVTWSRVTSLLTALILWDRFVVRVEKDMSVMEEVPVKVIIMIKVR